MKAKDFRAVASKKAKPVSGVLALIYLVYALLTGLLSFTFIGQLLVGPSLLLGVIIVSKLSYTDKKPEVSNLFDGFAQNFGKAIGVYLLQAVYIFLWGFWSLGIGALIKSYSYSMAFYILEEHPEMTCNEAITKSKEMMSGNKWRLFCLHFSYIGWDILICLTCGILALWVCPKQQIAEYAFYEEVKGEVKVEVVK